MMKILFNDLKSQWAKHLDAIKADMGAIINTCNFMDSRPITMFEEKLARLHSVSHAIGVSDGTAALYLLLRGYDIGPGDEVIFPANTFIATAFAISMTGATPVPCDVDLDGLIDVKSIKERITNKTKAVVVVHLFGCAVDLTQIRAAIGDLLLFEDAAQSIGNTHADMGKTSAGASISFYPGKNLGAFGQAGGILLNRADIADKIRCILNQGQVAKYMHKYKGGNFRLDALQAIPLTYGIDSIVDWNNARIRIGEKYNSLLSEVFRLNLRNSVYHIYPIILSNSMERNEVVRELDAVGVSTSIHYPIPVHKTEAYSELSHFECKNAEHLCDRILSLPMFTSMTDEQVEYVVKCVYNIL